MVSNCLLLLVDSSLGNSISVVGVRAVELVGLECLELLYNLYVEEKTLSGANSLKLLPSLIVDLGVDGVHCRLQGVTVPLWT